MRLEDSSQCTSNSAAFSPTDGIFSAADGDGQKSFCYPCYPSSTEICNERPHPQTQPRTFYHCHYLLGVQINWTCNPQPFMFVLLIPNDPNQFAYTKDRYSLNAIASLWHFFTKRLNNFVKPVHSTILNLSCVQLGSPSSLFP